MEMSKRKRNRAAARAEPSTKRGVTFYCDSSQFGNLKCRGYTTLADNPEIATAVDTIARLIGVMTIHLMENTDRGDVRIKNELSKKVDIAPYHNMTRSNWVRWIVRTQMLSGNGNAVVYPVTQNGYITDLQPIPPAYVSFVPSGMWDYDVLILGEVYRPDDVLHFAFNPGDYYPWLGRGYQVELSTVADNLKQAAATENGFMSSEWKPALIVKVDGLTDEFSSPEGRDRLLQNYITSGRAGEPWIIPADQFDVQQVKPLSLSDLALADFVKLDKQTVASILGIPTFVLGEGAFSRDAWNNFISSTIMPIAENIQQELTRKLLYNPDWYFRFNSRSLYNYDLRDLSSVGNDEYVRGIMTGNEVRNWLGLAPMDGLDDLVILENYIPRGMIGDQSKLQGGENNS